jgi:hypothetical protein
MLGFNEDGSLPPGDHEMSLASLRESVLVNGTRNPGSEDWDAHWRAHLVDQLGVLCGHLWNVGISEIFVDGSFVTDKSHPGDIDGYFVCEFGQFHSNQFRRLLDLDPVWDLRTKSLDVMGKPKPLMWHKYSVELFPHFLPPFSDQSAATIDQAGRAVLFPEFFRYGRDGKPRGIVRITREH